MKKNKKKMIKKWWLGVPAVLVYFVTIHILAGCLLIVSAARFIRNGGYDTTM